MEKEFISHSAAETQKIGSDFGKALKGGDVLALYGDLGAGKTTFIQGLVASLGYSGRVFSPTFIFIRPYNISDQRSVISDQKKSQKIKTFHHIDLYRIENETDLKTLGIEEFVSQKDAISAIEWPEKIENFLPKKTIKIKFETLGETERKITFV